MPFYKPKPPTPNSYKSSSMTTIPVIASFSTSGIIKPLYLRIQDKALEVISCWSQKEFPVVKYHCSVQYENCRKDIILTYHPENSFWTINTDILS